MAIIGRQGILIFKTSMEDYQSFEFLRCCISSAGAPFTLITIYLPGLRIITGEFYDEFAQLLLRVNALPLYLAPIITEDYNIRLDKKKDSDNTIKFTNVL